MSDSLTPDESVPASVPRIFLKTLYENEKGMTVIHRNPQYENAVDYDAAPSPFDDEITPLMGIVNLNMQMSNGMAHQIQREFPMPGVETIYEAFKRYEELMKAAIPGVQARLQRDMAEAQKAAPKIQRTDRGGQGQHGWRAPGAQR